MNISKKSLEQSTKSRAGYQRGKTLPYGNKMVTVKEICELSGASKTTVNEYCFMGNMSVENFIKRFKK